MTREFRGPLLKVASSICFKSYLLGTALNFSTFWIKFVAYSEGFEEFVLKICELVFKSLCRGKELIENIDLIKIIGG